MKNVHLVLNWGGEWKNHHGEYWYEGRRAKTFAFSRDSNYDQLLDKVYNVTGIDRDYYRVSMTTLPQTFRPSMPIEIVDDEDVALLLRRENVDPLVCISVEEIGHESPEMKPKPPQSSHNLHVNTMHELQRSDVHNMAAHLDDIGEGLTPVANIDTSPHSHLNFRDTTGNQHIPEHDETEPLFNYNREAAPNRYDEQFAHVQRLVPPPCAFYSINSGEVAPRPVTMRLEVGELFPSKKQLQSHVGSYALTNGFQIRVFKSDTTRYQVRCIVEDCNWRLRAAKVHNSDYFQIRKFDNQHTCSTEAQFPHQRQASARVIGEHIQEKFRDHRLYKPKEIIHDMQREFGISCNYHKGYRARHIALEEVQGTPVESYSILPSYLYMLEQANPGTVTDLHTDSSNRFMYMFFCLKACIDGFLSSIRPVIVIDGTFLKGPHRGVLFVAVCMDGNEQIFPLAFGVGDSETNEAWEWFLTKLHKAVGEVDDLVIVSDRKGELTAGGWRDGQREATRRQLDGNSTATRRRLDGEVSGNWSGQGPKRKTENRTEKNEIDDDNDNNIKLGSMAWMKYLAVNLVALDLTRYALTQVNLAALGLTQYTLTHITVLFGDTGGSIGSGGAAHVLADGSLLQLT
ncbi:hypothetical protein Q3G72_026703 [Acer saccharum]|nr:hypothetical protein Q3G72_026703 [Acer saccharum]